MKSIKRIAVIVAAFLAFAVPASAQFKIGPRVGLEVNKMHFSSDLFDGENRAGFTAGLQMEFIVPAVNLGFDASVMYVRRDGEVHAANGNVTSNNRDYINIPINLKWKFGLPLIGSIVKPYLFTGPDFAFLTSRRAINEAWKNKSFDVSWNFGFGLEFFKHLQVGASYGIGCSKAAERIDLVNSTQDINGKNRYWTVTAAYLF